MVNSDEVTGATEYLTLYEYKRCRIKRCRYNWVQLYYTSSRRIRTIESRHASILKQSELTWVKLEKPITSCIPKLSTGYLIVCHRHLLLSQQQTLKNITTART
jgi:hypothetical protein